MDEFKPNSYKARSEAEEEKKIEKVVTGPVKVKKKTEMHKFKDVFISEDAHNVKSYILLDVLVPAIKKAVKDIVTDGIEMILYGETGRKDRGRSGSNASYVSYNRYSDRDEPRRDRSSGTRSIFDYDDLIFETRGDAEAALDRMDEILDRYKVVSVLDFYDVAGVPNNNSQTNKYGWTNIRSAEILRTRDGYMIRMPKALPIN